MPTEAVSVLLPMRLPTQKLLRAAVAHIIRDVQRDHNETDQCTADRLGVSIGTVRSARNEASDLNAVTIARIGAVYGAHYVDPYHRLYGATASVVQREGQDPLIHLAKAVSTICEMRSPDSPGGVSETPQELLSALPVFRAAIAALTAHVGQIERLRAVA
jgi:hypothetical protein